MAPVKSFKAAAVILSVFLLNVILIINTCPQAQAGPADSPFNKLSEEDKARAVKILQNVSKHKNEPTRETFREFWIIWEKQKRWPDADIQDLRDRLVGPSLVYMTYVWQDALDSLQTRTAQKSVDRAKYEKRLLALGILSEAEINKNDDMINKIAHNQPLTTDEGQEYIVSETGIELILTGLLEADTRVNRLFSKEYVEPQ